MEISFIIQQAVNEAKVVSLIIKINSVNNHIPEAGAHIYLKTDI